MVLLSVVSQGDGKCEDNGSAKLNADNIPYLFYEGKWFPICKHYFLKTKENGAKAFCQELGYSDGRLESWGGHYSQDAIVVGRCGPGEAINSCTAGFNFYNTIYQCKKGQKNTKKGVKITISCDGHTKGTEKTSCSGCEDIDTSGHCPTWKDQGFCTDSHVEYMKTNCANTCNTC